MVGVILDERKVQTKLQFAVSQRFYYEELSEVISSGRVTIPKLHGLATTVIAANS